MTIDPTLNTILKDEPKLTATTVAGMRQHVSAAKSRWNTPIDRPGLTVAADGSTRIYQPAIASGAPVVHLHGGGWAICSPDSHHAILSALALQTGRVVYAPHPRQAPEHPYPAPLDDTLAVLHQIATRHPDGFFLSGDSAGAHLACAAVLHARDAGRPLPVKAMLLVYGCFRRTTDTFSHHRFGDGRFGLTSDRMAQFWDWFDPAHGDDGYTDLSLAQFHDFPPAVIHAAACDPLLDDSIWLDARLKKFGHRPALHVWPGMTHGFLHYHDALVQAQLAVEMMASFMTDHEA